MYTKRNLATDIVDLFDDLLAEKGIEVPCSDPDEEAERHNDENYACLYGIEYWGSCRSGGAHSHIRERRRT